MVELRGAGDRPAAEPWTPTAFARPISTRSKSSARPIAASVFRPASTTCRLDTSMRFDRALAEYLMRRSERERLKDDLLPPLLSLAGTALVGGADRAASDHAAAAQALEFPALRFIQKRQDVNRRRLQIAALAAAAVAGGGDRAVGVRPGAAERQAGRGVGQPGGARGGGAGVRRRPAHGISPREPDPAGGRPGNGPVALGAIARAERRSRCSTRGWARRRPFSPTAARPRSGSRGWRRWPTASRCRPRSRRP